MVRADNVTIEGFDIVGGTGHGIDVQASAYTLVCGNAAPLASDGNLLGVDPRFIDAAGFDFRLSPESPAYGLGWGGIRAPDDPAGPDVPDAGDPDTDAPDPVPQDPGADAPPAGGGPRRPFRPTPPSPPSGPTGRGSSTRATSRPIMPPA